MRIHAREMNVRDAENDIRSAISKAMKDHDLTTGEALRAVNGAASRWIRWIGELATNQERSEDEEDEP